MDSPAPEGSPTMGRRSATESAIAVLAALIEKRSWTQVELADRVGISIRALRTCLLDMERSGTFPIDRVEEPPHGPH